MTTIMRGSGDQDEGRNPVTHLAYCQTCKRDHYFGFDETGQQLELLQCLEGKNKGERMNIDEVKQAAIAVLEDVNREEPPAYTYTRPAKSVAETLLSILADPSELLPAMVWDVADGEGCKTAFGTYWVWDENGRWCWCIGLEQGVCTSQEDGRLHCREHLRSKVRELFGAGK